MGRKQDIYKNNIIKQLYFNNEVSCTEISYKIGKSLPLTTNVVDELVEEGIVVENGFANSTGGRRAHTYSIRRDWKYILAVAMDQFFTSIAILDMRNNPVYEIEKYDFVLDNTPSSIVLLSEKIDNYINKTGVDKTKIVGVGIGMPGFVDIIKGINYTFLPVVNQSINQFISTKVGLPVFIDNDSRLIALAELEFGIGKKRETALVINIAWGIGLGLILNGELFRGQNGMAGEFSHIPLFSNNKLCSCGKMGCLETEASLLAIINKVAEGIQSGALTSIRLSPENNHEQSWEMILSAAAKGDKFAIEMLFQAGYNIGRGLAVLIHLLNPEIIILSGLGSIAGNLWLPPVHQALNEHCIPRLASGSGVQVSSLGEKAGLIGAATLVMENFEGTQEDT